MKSQALFKQKMTVNFGGSIDPYFFENTNGFTRNAFAVSNANFTMNYALASNKDKEKKLQAKSLLRKSS